ncbi:MAG TPA: hypothetical protein VLX68_15505 [Chitinivibrionales bacterium]|nr:hypothetical protein [Chitinivibrionales bacterium]
MEGFRKLFPRILFLSSGTAVLLLGLFLVYSFALISPSPQFSLRLFLTALFTRGSLVVEGNNGWLFFRQGFSYEVMPWPKENGVTIIDFNRKLQMKGIRLFVVPVPDKSDVYPELLNLGDPVTVSVQRESLIRNLRESNVNVIDLLPVFRSLKGRDTLYFKYDSHWNQTGIIIAAKVISGEIMKLEPALSKQLDLQSVDTVGGRFEDLYTALNKGAQRGRETPAAWKAVVSGDGQIFKGGKDAPIMIFGDSFTEIGRSYGAQLSSQIALFSGIPARTFFSLGANLDGPPILASFLKQAKTKPKIVVWVFISHALQKKLNSFESQRNLQ